jgi:glycosyltransferase involved in cell wall biosynthesis
MRIVYVTQRLPFGTGETFVVPEVDALLGAGHEVLIVPQISKEPVVHDDVGALLPRTLRLPGAVGLATTVAAQIVREPRETLQAFWRLRHTRPRWRAILNARATAQGIWAGHLAKAWGADHIHAHWAYLTATIAMAASAVSGIPWSFTAHRYDLVRNNLLAQKLRSARFGRFISQETLAMARSLVSPDAMARAILLHMGVVLPRLPEGPSGQRARPIVLCPARFVPVKGHTYLLEAAARLKHQGVAFEVWLAGDGPGRQAITERINRLGLTDSVRLLGIVPHAELLRFYRNQEVDCVVLPSLDLGGGVHEGISVALMEAMAHGVPTIATRTGGSPELLGGGAGLLVPQAEPDALAEALARILGSAALRSELGGAGRRRVAEEFEVVAITRELVRRFDGMLPRDRRRENRPHRFPERRVLPERRYARSEADTANSQLI